VIAIATDPAMHEKMLSNLSEVKARGASVVAVATDDDEMIESVADFVLRVPATEPMFTPMVDVISLQMFAYAVARSWSKRRPAAEPRQDGDGRIVATVGVASTSSTCRASK